ncbi:acyl-CoA thioesterase [Gammaproteobacteria bacterium]|nr:acyl-CoA thioesterase [Gammaproteobacteria bacterium]
MTRPHRVDEIPFLANLGIEVENASDGRRRISAPVTPRVINPCGVLHGGITFTLADTGMGIAAYTLLASGERTTTVESSIRYLRPAKSGRIIAECHVIRRSNRFAITEAKVFDEAGEVVAVAGGSFYISRSKT